MNNPGWGFTVQEGGDAIAEINPSWFGERAEIRVKGRAYSAYRESMLAGTFVLQSGERALARAQKVSAFVRAFDIDLAGRPMELKAISFWAREVGLFENGVRVGRIGPVGWFGRQVVIDLRLDVPLPARLFLLWLVLVLWRSACRRRRGRAAPAGGLGSRRRGIFLDRGRPREWDGGARLGPYARTGRAVYPGAAGRAGRAQVLAGRAARVARPRAAGRAAEQVAARNRPRPARHGAIARRGPVSGAQFVREEEHYVQPILDRATVGHGCEWRRAFAEARARVRAGAGDHPVTSQ
jgi:hypothetical protein